MTEPAVKGTRHVTRGKKGAFWFWRRDAHALRSQQTPILQLQHGMPNKGRVLAVVEREAAEALVRGKAAEWEKRETQLRETEWSMHEAAIAAAKRGLAAYMDKDKVYANLADIARMLEIASKLGRLATGLDKSNGETADEPQTLRVEVTVALEKIYGEPEIVDVQTMPVLPEKTA